MGRERIGWHEVRPATGEVPAGPWFQWHADRIAVPPGAEVLADSADGPEAFRVGTSIGLQFHPEMTVELLDRWLAAPPLTEPARPADHHAAERDAGLRADTARHEPAARARTERLLERLALV